MCRPKSIPKRDQRHPDGLNATLAMGGAGKEGCVSGTWGKKQDWYGGRNHKTPQGGEGRNHVELSERDSERRVPGSAARARNRRTEPVWATGETRCGRVAPRCRGRGNGKMHHQLENIIKGR